MPPDLRPGRGSIASHEQTVRIKGADGTKTAPKPGSGSKHNSQNPRQSPRPSNQRVLQRNRGRNRPNSRESGQRGWKPHFGGAFFLLQPWHKCRCAPSPSPCACSLRQPAQLGRDRDRRSARPVPRSTHRHLKTPRLRDRRLAAPAQPQPRAHQMNVHHRQGQKQNPPRLSRDPSRHGFSAQRVITSVQKHYSCSGSSDTHFPVMHQFASSYHLASCFKLRKNPSPGPVCARNSPGSCGIGPPNRSKRAPGFPRSWKKTL